MTMLRRFLARPLVRRVLRSGAHAGLGVLIAAPLTGLNLHILQVAAVVGISAALRAIHAALDASPVPSLNPAIGSLHPV